MTYKEYWEDLQTRIKTNNEEINKLRCLTKGSRLELLNSDYWFKRGELRGRKASLEIEENTWKQQQESVN